MEVKIERKYPVQTGVMQAWSVLVDIRATAACMPGAQITEQVDDTRYKGMVKSKIGPAVMTFVGDIELQHMDEMQHEVRMLGKGADKSGSSATMTLTARIQPADDADNVLLVGEATVTVSGKLAQFGSRLLVPVMDALLAQFANNFRAAASARTTHDHEAAGSANGGASGVSTITTAGKHADIQPPQPAKELNVLSLVQALLKSWFARWFRRSPRPDHG